MHLSILNLRMLSVMCSSLLKESLFLKHAAELMLGDTMSLITWSNFFRLNILSTCKHDQILVWLDVHFWWIPSCVPNVFCNIDRSWLTWEKVEDLKMEHCYIAEDYAAEVNLFKVVSSALTHWVLSTWRLIHCSDWSRMEQRKLKRRQGVGSCHLLLHQLKSSLLKRRLQGRLQSRRDKVNDCEKWLKRRGHHE